MRVTVYRSWRLIIGCVLLLNPSSSPLTFASSSQGRLLRGLFAWQTATPYTDPDGLCTAGATGYRATKDCSGFVFCNNGYLMGGGEDGEAIGSVTKCDAGMKYDEAVGGCTVTGGVNCPTNDGVSSSESSSSSSIEEEEEEDEDDDNEDEAFIEQDQPEQSPSLPIQTEEEEVSKPSNSAFNSYYNRPYGPNGPNTTPTPPSATPTEAESEIIDTQAPTSLVIMPKDETVANILVQGVLEDMEPSSSTFDIVTFNTSDEVEEAEDFEEQEEDQEEVTTETGKGWKGELYAPACPVSFTGNVAYPECKGYATCINGIFVGAPVECSAGLLFDKTLGLCDFESNVVCDEEVNEYSNIEDERIENDYEEVEEEMDEKSTDEVLSQVKESLSPTPFETPSPTSSMTQNAVLFYDKLQGSVSTVDIDEEEDSSLVVDKTSAPTLMTTERDVDNDGENWSVIESYTYRPTPQPNIPLSMSPVTLYEGDPAKRYCGYSWRDVIDSCLTAIPCPGAFGVCPDRMGCIADTPCADETYLNYLRGRQQEVGAESQQLVSSPPTVFATSSMTSTPPTNVATTMMTSDPPMTASIAAMTTSVFENPPGNVFFCAFTYSELTSQCLQSKPCPSGIASDFCESTQGCFAATSCTDEYELAGAVVTIVSAPPTTDIPSTPTPQTTAFVSVPISTAAPSNIVSLSTEQPQSLTMLSTEQPQSLTMLSTEQAIADAWLSNTEDEQQVLNDPLGHLPPLPSPKISANPTIMYTTPQTESPTMLYAMAVEASASEVIGKELTPMTSELENTLLETTTSDTPNICRLCGDSEINTTQLVNLDGDEVSCDIFDLVFSSANIEDGSTECFDYRGQYFSSCCRVQSVDDVNSIIEKCILCSDSVPNEETVVLFAGEELLCTEVATRLLVEDEISSDSEICETSKSSYSDMCCLQDTGTSLSGVMASSGFAQTTPEIVPEYWMSMSISNQASTRSTIPWMFLTVLVGLLYV